MSRGISHEMLHRVFGPLVSKSSDRRNIFVLSDEVNCR